jgi:hypothetical protein
MPGASGPFSLRGGGEGGGGGGGRGMASHQAQYVWTPRLFGSPSCNPTPTSRSWWHLVSHPPLAWPATGCTAPTYCPNTQSQASPHPRPAALGLGLGVGLGIGSGLGINPCNTVPPNRVRVRYKLMLHHASQQHSQTTDRITNEHHTAPSRIISAPKRSLFVSLLPRIKKTRSGYRSFSLVNAFTIRTSPEPARQCMCVSARESESESEREREREREGRYLCRRHRRRAPDSPSHAAPAHPRHQ